MDKKELPDRIEKMEKKLDLVLEYVTEQRNKSEVVEDLISDLSLIGKEVYNTSVAGLERQSVEINPDQLSEIGINLLKNIGNFNRTLALLTNMAEQEDIPRYSLWKVMREMNSPEMKTAMGFMMTFMKRFAKNDN